MLRCSTNKTDRNDIIEILLKVALNTINQTKPTTPFSSIAGKVVIRGYSIFLDV